eukprot:SAG11_NODE_440_length_9448_cov_3.356509_1_plen_148_part_00
MGRPDIAERHYQCHQAVLLAVELFAVRATRHARQDKLQCWVSVQCRRRPGGYGRAKHRLHEHSCNELIHPRLNNGHACFAEHNELSKSHPAKLAELQALHVEAAKTAFNPDRGAKDPRACEQAVGVYGNGAGCFWGPFAFLNNSLSL